MNAGLDVLTGFPLARPRRASKPVDRRTVLCLLFAATVIAAALRLPFLGHQSLWFDEIYTRNILGEPTLSGLWNHVRATESTPPLYYVLAWLLGGRSAAAMRVIPACALIAAVPVSYFAFRRMIGERAALATAAILAVSPDLVGYSLDARAYGLLVLTALLSVWAFSSLLELASGRRYLAWALASIVCVWTHYFGIFLVVAEALVLLSRPSGRKATIAWSAGIAACIAPLVPLAVHQNGNRSGWISQSSLASRLTQTVRQSAMGANVPRSWLEAAGIAVAFGGLAVGAIMAARGDRRQRALLGLAAVAFALPLLSAVSHVEDRFNDRNVLFVVPLVAALAAPALLRLRAAPLAVYLSLAAITSIWVATNWRYEQIDWRTAVARSQSIDPGAAVIAVTPTGQAVAQTYLGRSPTNAPVLAREAWLVVEPYRAAHQRALGPAPIPATITAHLPGFTSARTMVVHGFRLLLLRAATPTAIVPASLPGAAIFPPR